MVRTTASVAGGGLAISPTGPAGVVRQCYRGVCRIVSAATRNVSLYPGGYRPATARNVRNISGGYIPATAQNVRRPAPACTNNCTYQRQRCLAPGAAFAPECNRNYQSCMSRCR
jgi:hypothetical protein